MGNNITDGLKYKESVVKFSKKYGVAKAAYKFGECKRTIYRWRNRYDGTLGSIMDKITSSRIYKKNTTNKERKETKKIGRRRTYKRKNKSKWEIRAKDVY